MSILVVVEPDRADLFAGSAVGDSELIDAALEPFADSLRTAYVRRVEAYHRDLRTAFGSEAYDEGEVRESAFPRLTLGGEDPEVVVIDDDLFATLFDLYLLDGWDPIRRIDAELSARAGPPGVGDESGTRGRPDLVAYRFFLFSRNMLALLVRDALIGIERRAAVRMVAQTSVAAAKVSTALTKDFGISRELIVPESHATDPGTGPTSLVYSIANQPLLRTLAAALEDAVKQRVAFEELLEGIASLKNELRRIDNEIEGSRFRGFPPRPSDVEERVPYAAAEKQRSDLRDATAGYYDAMKAVIGMNCPLALLVVDRLQPGFAQRELEQVLGEMIWDLAERFDALGRGIDPDTSMVVLGLAGIEPSSSGWISPASVERLAVPAMGPEAAIAKAALDGLDASPAWFPMLHETTWRLLVQQGEIAPDGFESVVLHHYLGALDAAIEDRAQAAEKAAAFWKSFAKVSSALAVALLVTPLAEVAPALVGISAAADLALVAWQVSSVTGQLARLDAALAGTLLESDAYATPSLGRLGELLIARGEFVRELGSQLMLELIGMMAAGQWPMVRRLLIARGFVMDLETILGADDNDE